MRILSQQKFFTESLVMLSSDLYIETELNAESLQRQIRQDNMGR